MDFPTTDAAGPTGINGTPLYGGGLSINELLHSLRKAASSSSAPVFTLALVNVYTLVDGFDPKSEKQAASAIAGDMELLALYFKAYAEAKRSSCQVIAYLPDYSDIQTICRPLSGSAQAKFDLYKTLCKTMASSPRNSLAMSENYGIVVTEKGFPAQRVIASLSETPVSYDGVAMVTHIPFDLHAQRAISGAVYLAERYTGNILTVAQCAKKIDSAGAIPFCKETHMAFGDRAQIKPILSGKARTKVIAQATEEVWVRRSPDDLRRRIASVMTADQKSEYAARLALKF